MEVLITIYERMLVESQRLEKQINSLQMQLKALPKEDFFCTRNGNNYKWYQTDGKKQIYLPKKKRQLAEQLATKKYLSLLSKDLINEKKAIDLYLKNHSLNPSQAEHLLASNPEYRNLLSPLFQPLSQELTDWIDSPYQHNPKYPEQLIHKSISGNMVRSKSEALIDMMLYVNKIPFRYECALLLNETTIFPDFTIRHPQTGETYYWEHFGKMDDPVYSKNVFSKLQLYNTHNIIPSIQLITTYETKKRPLTSETIEEIIKQYFG